MTNERKKVLDVNNLRVSFKTDNGLVQAVRGVSFELFEGETLCIVGESGSGKSVTSKTIMGILANNAVVEEGSIMYEGDNLLEISEEEYYRLRGNKLGMIFQDPLSSLNPIVRIGKQITEAMLINNDKMKKMYSELIAEDLSAYKNEINKLKVSIERMTVHTNHLNDNLLKSITDDSSKEEKNSVNKQIKVNNLKLKEEIKTLSASTKESIAILKGKYKESQISAKDKVSKYKKDLVLKHKTKINELKKEMAVSSDKEALKMKIKAEKLDFVNSLKITKAVAKERALKIMREVGIPEPERRFKQYPFEFSGGMRQRIVIAIALTADPDILICDEPTTALDVTIQAQILELINNLKKERNLSCVFITHDLGVVANMADRVAVMYAGKIVEYGTSEEIFFEPKHPYTWALLSSIPDIDSLERLESIPGTPPNMIYPPKGDAFALRSKYALNIDHKQQPPFFKVSETHYAATWLLHPDAPKVEMPKIVSTRIEKALQGGSV